MGEENHGPNRGADQTLHCHTAEGAGRTHAGTDLAAAPEPVTRAGLAYHHPRAPESGVRPYGVVCRQRPRPFL